MVCVGRLERQKNLFVTIDAFASVARRRPGLRFALIGEGAQRAQLQERIDEHGLGARIELLGFRSDAADLIDAASLLVTLSLYEGMPNVLVEAIVRRTPVVVSDIPQHRDVLGPSYSHAVAEFGDAEAAGQIIDDALENGTDDLSEVRDHLLSLTPSKVADAYARVFSQTVGR
ncbi:hypothetical protein ASD11_14090 [Aeromicrobium sp. Root495]|nr:hypothetical protein ASD11_14090 [Aeromicrobium sp. Root495]